MTPLEAVKQIKEQMGQSIIGQEKIVDRLLIVLLADGNLLLEGLPGLAKTRAIKSLAQTIDAGLSRIQFTPDLLPSDITGTEILAGEGQSFIFQQGPIFNNFILADEINRAPAKVQSALLEAMQERQVTVGKKTHDLPDLFLVMATQNPIEQEGTYPLPEAQMDRFLMHVMIQYPSVDDEKRVISLVREEERGTTKKTNKRETVAQQRIFDARNAIRDITVSDTVEKYIVTLIDASRHPKAYDEELATWIDFGSSPRGSIALDKCSRVVAWMNERDYVTPDDVKAIAHDVLRHRILLSFEATAEGIKADDAIDRLLQKVAVS